MYKRQGFNFSGINNFGRKYATGEYLLLLNNDVEVDVYKRQANAFEEDKQNALNAGMNGHIAKPLDIPHLLKVCLLYTS